MPSQDPPPPASTSRSPSASAPASLSHLPTSFNSHQPPPDAGSPTAREGAEDVEMDEDARARVAELDEEARGVEEENARFREKLVQVEESLAALPELEQLDEGDRPTPLELELARLETTLEYLSSYSPDALSTRSPLLSSELALASIQSTVQELEGALKREYDKREEEEGRMERDRQWVEDAELLEGVLERRVREAREAQEGEGGGRGDGEVLVLRSQARIQRLTAQFKRLQGALVQFIDERLVEAEPDSENGGAAGEEGEGGGRKKRKKGRGDEVFNLHAFIHALGPGEPAEKRAFELKKLIEALMNAAASTSPSSSASTSPLPTWLPLSSLTPPPPEELVRFLLRARIARENPRDAGEVRLEDFAVR